MTQLSMWDLLQTEESHYPGEWLEEHGANICHVMRPGYVGRLICIDCSTVGHRWYQVGRLERYFFMEDERVWRAVVYTGSRQRSLISFRPGIEIFEVEPWDYERRTKGCLDT